MSTVMEQLQKQDPSLTTTGSGDVAVLFIHGFLDDQSVWDDVVSELATANAQFLRLDLAGMGDRSGDEGPYSLERYADDPRIPEAHERSRAHAAGALSNLPRLIASA